VRNQQITECGRRQRQIGMLAMCVAGAFACTIGKAEQITIEVVDYYDVKDQLAGMTELNTEFEKQYPDIKVKHTYIPFADLPSRVLQMAAVHKPPAVAAIDNPDVRRVARAGILKDLAGNISTLTDWKDVYNGPRNAVTEGTQIFGAPVNHAVLCLYYNKKMFRDAGIAGPPETWEQLLEDAPKLKKDAIYGIAFSAVNTEESTWQWEPFLWSNGGSLLDLTTTKAKDALKLWLDLVKSGGASRDMVNWNQGDVANQFLSEKAAMMVMGNWMLPSAERSGLDFGVVPIPVPKLGEKPVVPLGGEAWCILKNDEKTEAAALKYVAFVEEPARAKKFDLTVSCPSPFRNTAESEAKDKPPLEPFIRQMETARARPDEGGAKYPQVSLAARTAIQKVLSEGATIDSALDEAAAQVKALNIAK
jgi:multiple sugar transport system substrate-binding protein